MEKGSCSKASSARAERTCEWCDPEVLQQIRRKTLSRLRREVVPAEQYVFARLLGRWQGVTAPRKGADALLDAIEILQGVDLIASDLEREILPARVKNYQPADLDALLSAGEIVWIGKGPLGLRDGRISLFLVESLGRLIPPGFFDQLPEGLSPLAVRILDFLQQHGASFQSAIHHAMGDGFLNDTSDALWELTWTGLVTNDTLNPLRVLLSGRDNEPQRAKGGYAPPGSPEFIRRMRARRGEDVGLGRWSLVRQRMVGAGHSHQWNAAICQQMLVRNGIVMRETGIAENVPGGYAAVYPTLKMMEENGWVRRGMFVAGMGAAQFATPPRSICCEVCGMPRIGRRRCIWRPRIRRIHTAACFPGWRGGAEHPMARAAGASVILVNGRLAVFFRRRNTAIRVMLPEDEPDRTQVARAVAQKLAEVAIQRQSRRSGLLIETINDAPAASRFSSAIPRRERIRPNGRGFSDAARRHIRAGARSRA